MTFNKSLLHWLTTFQLDERCCVSTKDDTYFSLADGYVCARVLNQIAPRNFTDKWLDGIKAVKPDGSWLLRISNLNRILKEIHDYTSDLQIPGFKLDKNIIPNVNIIAQNFDADQISRLIQLILLIAITCDKKQDYIRKIGSLPTQVQEDIKRAIEDIFSCSGDAHNLSKQTNSANVSVDYDDGDNESSRKHSNQSNHSNNVTPTQARAQTSRGLLSRETSQIIQSANVSQTSAVSKSEAGFTDAAIDDEVKQRLKKALDEKAQTCHELEGRVKQLQTEVDHLSRENEKLVTNDKEKNSPSRFGSSPLRIMEAFGRRQSQSNRASDNNGDKYKIDEESYNNILETNKRLSKEVEQLKEELIKTDIEKENYREKSNLLKDDLDKLSSKHDELRRKAEQAKRLRDELDELNQISEKIINYESTIDTLKKKDYELKKSLKALEDKSAAQSQTIVGLEEEMKRKETFISKMDSIYKAQLDEARIKAISDSHRADKAEVELIKLTEEFSVIKLENDKLAAITSQLMNRRKSFGDVQEVPETERFRDLDEKGSPLGSMSANSHSVATQNRIEDLQRKLFQREQDLQELDVKYKRSLQKARDLVRQIQNGQTIQANSLHPSCISPASSYTSASLDEVNILKRQIKEQHEIIMEKDREYSEFKRFKEYHERLMVSAFYGLTIPMQRKNADKRLEKSTITTPPNTASSSMNQ